jgi:hypothetical protein
MKWGRPSCAMSARAASLACEMNKVRPVWVCMTCSATMSCRPEALMNSASVQSMMISLFSGIWASHSLRRVLACDTSIRGGSFRVWVLLLMQWPDRALLQP